MVVDSNGESNYDRKSELIAFDETKAGVKGLVDNGVTEVPRIFIRPSNYLDNATTSSNNYFSFPEIDLESIDKNLVRRKEVVNKVKDAAASWGFFQVINHGIPLNDLDEMIRGVRRFFEQDNEVKKQWYTRDFSKRVVYNSNADLFIAPAAKWRDSFYCTMAPNPPKREELPESCREILITYSEHIMKLGCSLLELLSEALGLESNHLLGMDCGEGLSVLSHYNPACPQPELTMGTYKHSDAGFLTLLLQDDIGGLQILHEKQWIDVPPKPHALVVNIGDLLQLISNDKFKSIEHRVLSKNVGPRISVASFFSTDIVETSKLYGPIKELLSEEEPPKYRAVTIQEYTQCFRNKGIGGSSTLLDFKL